MYDFQYNILLLCEQLSKLGRKLRVTFEGYHRNIVIDEEEHWPYVLSSSSDSYAY